MLPKHQAPVRFRYPALVRKYMKILSIETSCDETAVSIIEAKGGTEKPVFTVLSNLVLSQVKLHEKYGGVFPNLAKREHAKNLGPLIKKALEEAGLSVPHKRILDSRLNEKIKGDLQRESELYDGLLDLFESYAVPKVDLIAVTFGPGLEPALWVGINAAKALGEVWNIPVMPINHMEGHISSVLLNLQAPVTFPVLSLLISGGHTELVLVPELLSYKIIGETKDDAVGEAYDKVARMLGLAYPGGPLVAALAKEAREASIQSRFTFPRPMLKSPDFNFSFSGLKTSVLYTIKKIEHIDEEIKKEICLAFEDAIIETLITKTRNALTEFGSRTLIIAGGVIANQTLRTSFEKLVAEFPDLQLLVPTGPLSTDNALMIALAAYVRHSKTPEKKYILSDIKAEGNVRLG